MISLYAPVATKQRDISARLPAVFCAWILQQGLWWLYQPHFLLNLTLKQAMLPRSVVDAGTAASDLELCCRYVCLPERQCTNISRSWHGRALGQIIHLNPVDYHSLRCLSEILVAMQYNNRLLAKPSTFLEEKYNFDQVNEFSISHGSVVTFSRCGGQM